MSEPTIRYIKRWSKEEKELVYRSNLPALDLANQLGRTRQAVENVRNRAAAKGVLTLNQLRNLLHRTIKTKASELMDEIDAIIGSHSSGITPRKDLMLSKGKE